MMVEVLKHREKPKDLAIMEILHNRMDLSESDKRNFLNMEKGYRGEVLFDGMTDKLPCPGYVLNDLLLKINNTSFQVDKLLIAPDQLLLYDVKNFEGEYLLDNDRLFKLPNSTEITNPLIQLNRCTTMLRQLLHSLGFNPQITSLVVFVNPEFSLFQAPHQIPILLPNQLPKYLQKLENSKGKLEAKHKLLAEKLISLHLTKSPHKNIPDYRYGDLRKGITCIKCQTFDVGQVGRKIVCRGCGHEENLEEAILRSIAELRLLFPEIRLTSNLVFDWCNILRTPRPIKRILGTKFKIVGVHQWAYYE